MVAEEMARRLDQQATRLESAVLETKIGRGSTIEIFLEGVGFAVSEPLQALSWTGQPARCCLPGSGAGQMWASTWYPHPN
jgi:hypothetical protein